MSSRRQATDPMVIIMVVWSFIMISFLGYKVNEQGKRLDAIEKAQGAEAPK